MFQGNGKVSSLLSKTGNVHLRVTIAMPRFAASLLSPTLSPAAVSTGQPAVHSARRISGMLIQFAALHAALERIQNALTKLYVDL